MCKLLRVQGEIIVTDKVASAGGARLCGNGVVFRPTAPMQPRGIDYGRNPENDAAAARRPRIQGVPSLDSARQNVGQRAVCLSASNE